MDRPKLPISGGIENRRSLRHEANVEVSLTSESNFYMGFTQNISEGGLFVATHDLLPIGERITLSFEIPDTNRKIEVIGEVRWQRTAEVEADGIFRGIGVRFLNLDPEDAASLKSFLDEREALFHPDD